MKFLLPLLAFTLLLITGCEKQDVRLLNDLAGTYTVEQIILTPESGPEVVLSPTATLNFLSCDRESNRTGGNCSLQVAGDSNLNLSYQVEAGDRPSLTVNPNLTPNDQLTDPVFEALRRKHTYDIADDRLVMTAAAQQGLPIIVNGATYVQQQIIAVR